MVCPPSPPLSFVFSFLMFILCTLRFFFLFHLRFSMRLVFDAHVLCLLYLLLMIFLQHGLGRTWYSQLAACAEEASGSHVSPVGAWRGSRVRKIGFSKRAFKVFDLFSIFQASWGSGTCGIWSLARNCRDVTKFRQNPSPGSRFRGRFVFLFLTLRPLHLPPPPVFTITARLADSSRPLKSAPMFQRLQHR